MAYKNLSESHPHIARDWDELRNTDFNLNKIYHSSREQVWWKCSEGHSYKVSVTSRVRSGGCKICNKKLNSEEAYKARLTRTVSFGEKHPDLVAEWHDAKNTPITPFDLAYGSNKKVWWKCNQGHEWLASLKSRNIGTGCPICGKKKQARGLRESKIRKSGASLATGFPQLVKEWDYNKNELHPNELPPYSNYRAFWKCKMGHSWRAAVNNRTINNSNCPECRPQTSLIEIYLLCEVRSVFPSTAWRKKIDGVECDLFIPSLQIAIEVDGGYWHSKKLEKDEQKRVFLANHGVVLVRVRDKSLPKISGNQISFSQSEDKQRVANRLMSYLSRFSSSFNKYPKTQQSRDDFTLMASRLPAPPDGETLADTDPMVAAQWNYEKNLPLSPDLFSRGSEQKVWWNCEIGHASYEATIKNKTLRRSGCPKCAELNRSEALRLGKLAKSKSLRDKFPDIADHWDTKANGDLNPNNISYGSRIKIHWVCSLGHTWEAAVTDMTKARRKYICPQCKNLRGYRKSLEE